MTSLERLLPGAWQGPSREAHWRRSRARRVLAALAAAAAVLIAWNALAPHAAATQSITVAAHDLPAGHLLTRADLTAKEWPASVDLPGALTESAAVGQVLTAPFSDGEPLTSSRLRAARSWPGASKGQVLVSVPVADPAVAAIARPGDHIDVFAGGQHSTVASDLLVVSAHNGTHTDSLTPSSLAGARSAESASSLLVACSPATAGEIAQAVQDSPTTREYLMIALHPQP